MKRSTKLGLATLLVSIFLLAPGCKNDKNPSSTPTPSVSSIPSPSTTVTPSVSTSQDESSSPDVTTPSVPVDTVMTVAEARAAAAGDVVEVEAVVLEMHSSGYLVADESGKIFVWLNKAVEVEIGDFLHIKGVVAARLGNMQIDGTKAGFEVTKITDRTLELPAEEAIPWTATEWDAYDGELGVKVSFTARVSVSGVYVNLFIDGSTREGSISYNRFALDHDKVYNFVAYTLEKSTTPRNVFLIISADEVAAPTAESVAISAEVTEVKVGYSITLSAAVTPSTAPQEVVWSSSDETLATVADGVVTALAAGEVTITAKVAANEEITDSVVITVLPDDVVIPVGDEVTVTAAYAGATSSNLPVGENSAELLGLDPAIFTVLGDKGGNTNNVGVNAGTTNDPTKTIRLYYGSSGTGNSIHITSTKMITNIVINTYKTVGLVRISNSTGVIADNHQMEAQAANPFAINDTTLSITNVNPSNTQIHIVSIEITYVDAEPASSNLFAATEFVEGDEPGAKGALLGKLVAWFDRGWSGSQINGAPVIEDGKFVLDTTLEWGTAPWFGLQVFYHIPDVSGVTVELDLHSSIDCQITLNGVVIDIVAGDNHISAPQGEKIVISLQFGVANPAASYAIGRFVMSNFNIHM